MDGYRWIRIDGWLAACMHTQLDGWVGGWMNRWREGRVREAQGFSQALYGPLSHLKEACLGCLPPLYTWEMILQDLNTCGLALLSTSSNRASECQGEWRQLTSTQREICLD